MKLLYLHGFRSTPQSHKAQLIAQRIRELGKGYEFECPQLPVSPAEAVHLVRDRAVQLIGKGPADQLTLIGSSLGGYYSTWIAEATGCRTVLLNPAVLPERDLRKHIGTQTVYQTHETIDIKAEYMHELRDLWVPRITRPERYFLIAAKNDEVLDWREMVSKYAGARQKILEGDDHGLSNFSAIIDEVLEFCGVPLPVADGDAALDRA